MVGTDYGKGLMRNSPVKWWGLSLCWAADLALLMLLAPAGVSNAVLACLYVVSWVLTLALVCHFPGQSSANKSLARIFLLAAFGRLLIPALPLVREFLSPDLSGEIASDLMLILPRLVSDLVLLAILASLMGLRQVHPRRLLLYAANPLVLVSLAGRADAQSFLAPVIMAALWLLVLDRKKTGFAAMGIAGPHPGLAMAAGIHFVDRSSWRKALLFLPGLTLCFLYGRVVSGSFQCWTAEVFGLAPGGGLAGLLLGIFADWAGILAMLILVACLAWIYLVEPDPLRSAYLAIGTVMVLFSPLDGRHLLILAPLLCLYPSAAWIFLQMAFFPWLSVPDGYPIGTGAAAPDWLLWSVLPAFFVLLILGKIMNRHLFSERTFKAPEDMAVIIPTLNESNTLEGCLDTLQNQAAVSEVVVADGGSSDNSLRIAAQKGAKIIRAERGRGVQIAAGIEASGADVVLVLHSDCRLEAGATGRILHHLKSRPEVAGGALGMSFKDRRLKFKLIAFLNNFRARWTGISFGDQAQFVRREALPAMGGFPALVLMEDVELSLRLKSVGLQLFLPGGVRVSGRRWKKTVFGANVLLVMRLCLRYLFERRWRGGQLDEKKYYRDYYGT